MKVKSVVKWGVLAACIVLVAACSKTRGVGGFGDDGLSAHGLGMGEHFDGQEAGEMYTNRAPHNQIYLFAYDQSRLSAKYIASVNAQAAYLRSHSSARVLIAGHTDERGSREYNVALGESRANTVADLMYMAGIERQQVRVVSYGKERPVNLGHDDASHAQNRRVELTYEATR